MIEHMNTQRELGRDLPADFSFSSAGDEPAAMISLWERLTQREIVAREEWRPISDKPTNEPNRIASFTRGFKELEKLDARTKDMLQIIQHLENNLVAIKEKKRIIEKRAKDCYEVVINSDYGDWTQAGFISLITYMYEMEFDIKYLPYPNNLIDAKSFEFVVKYTKFLYQMEEATKSNQAYSLKNLTKNQAFFAECKETILNSMEAGKTWRQPDQLDARVDEFVGLLPQGLQTKELDVNQSKVLTQLSLEVFRRDFVRFMLLKDKDQLRYIFGTKEIDLLIETVVGKVKRVIPDQNPNKSLSQNSSSSALQESGPKASASSKRIKFERPKVKLAMLHTFDASYSNSKQSAPKAKTRSQPRNEIRIKRSLNSSGVLDFSRANSVGAKRQTPKTRSKSKEKEKQAPQPMFAQYKRGFFQSRKKTDGGVDAMQSYIKDKHQSTVTVAGALATTSAATNVAKRSKGNSSPLRRKSTLLQQDIAVTELSPSKEPPKTALKANFKTFGTLPTEDSSRMKRPEGLGVKWGDQAQMFGQFAAKNLKRD